MTYFDEYGSYWGDKATPFAGAADKRLSARSVKIFADGTSYVSDRRRCREVCFVDLDCNFTRCVGGGC